MEESKSSGDCFPEIIDAIKKRNSHLEEVQTYKAGWCDHCNVKRTVITTSLRGKRQKIGSFCPVCYSINNWVK